MRLRDRCLWHEEVRRDVNRMGAAVAAGHHSSVGQNPGWHVADQADHSVCEQSGSLEEEDCKESPEHSLGHVYARMAVRILGIALESFGWGGRQFGLEDGGETRRQLLLTTVLHRHLLVKLAILGHGRSW